MVNEKNEHSVEILQVSSLEDYEWPENDPHSVHQRTRIFDNNDLQLVKYCLQKAKLNMDAFKKNARKENLTTSEQVLRILSHQKFQMNPVQSVRNEIKWKECIEKYVNKEEPIDIVYPQFCVIPNAPKRYTNTGYSAGEDSTIEFFKQINEQIKIIYPPGVKFHTLADASLYASAFQTQQTEVDAYYESLKNRIHELNADDCIFIYDYADLLRTMCHQEYQNLYYKYSHKVWNGEIELLLPNTNIDTLWRSVRCSVNTRRFQLEHTDHLALFGPMKYRNYNHPLYSMLQSMTDIAFREVVSIRLACTDIDIATRKWPDSVRATCHKGQKNGHWPIGLRVYPEYYGSCKLLPYHGMPLINRDSKGNPRLEIYPEVLLRGNEDLVRVTIGNSDEVYVYICNDIEKGRKDEVSYKSPIGMRISEFEE